MIRHSRNLHPHAVALALVVGLALLAGGCGKTPTAVKARTSAQAGVVSNNSGSVTANNGARVVTNNGGNAQPGTAAKPESADR